jgi:hypothetical protein
MSESADSLAAAAAAAAAAVASSSIVPPPSSSVEAAAADLIMECQVNVPYDEFADDVEHHLGRANGNVHVRRHGVEGAHDGQIMVRLKKKRFVKCTMSNCSKIGVPVCLWDSEPEEVDSLYLRSGAYLVGVLAL